MGKSRKDQLRCSKCLKKDYIHYLRDVIDHKTWINVKVIAKTGPSSYLCKCSNCGHTYKTSSKAANRSFRIENKLY